MAESARRHWQRPLRACTLLAAAASGMGLSGCDISISLYATGPASMPLILIQDAAARNAVCADGSPAGYYLKRGRGAGANRWIIHLRGGPGCASAAECAAQFATNPDSMSSLYWQPRIAVDGMFSIVPSLNPDFYDANHVYLIHCSADRWTGMRTASPATGGFHFQGATIIAAVIEDLSNPALNERPNLGDATEVLFTGSSAGGIGLLSLLDWLGTLVPWAAVKGVVDAGWPVDIPPFSGPPGDPAAEIRNRSTFYNAVMDASCLAANLGAVEFCYFGPDVYPHITTPVFIRAAQIDPQVLEGHGVSEPYDTPAKTAYVNQYAQTIAASLAKTGLRSPISIPSFNRFTI